MYQQSRPQNSNTAAHFQAPDILLVVICVLASTNTAIFPIPSLPFFASPESCGIEGGGVYGIRTLENPTL